ncbi:hypothetical protein O6H91_14G074900 [Diphasiastrum complanatum]|uniref:Uncharacterized protein n=1 Tax=Diphasiastrum complanatum TaxID=34168 RepID=A0ACC2BQW0_DIPCM|nr:hypothetical protein O6H91_Y114400 [Diphasiastrum complanatum]KAJ7532182.1 hypothetical protein O6H91_14G074900 [Diphasiastrum complanatum]
MFLQWLLAVTGVAFIFRVATHLRDVWWYPLQISKCLQAQGVQGPPSFPIVGNQPEIVRLLAEAGCKSMKPSSNEIVPRILPHYTRWSKIYGETLIYTFGSEVRLTITDPELMKEILSDKFGHFPKVPASPAVRDLFGDGLVTSSGEKWAYQRRILNSGFYVDKLKAMEEKIAELATKMCHDWESRIVEANHPKGVEIDVLKEYLNLTADVIAHTAFGINYEAAKTVFKLQYHQVEMAEEARKSIRLPGQSLLPTTKNLYRWKIRKVIENNLHQIVKKRLHSESQNEMQHNDLLGIMISTYKDQMQGSQNNMKMSIQDIVDECKTFFSAGHETTASWLSWTTMLLALHPEWQERLRAEVINVCGNKHLNSDKLNKLKLVGMVLNEVLRLYPVAPVLFRCTDRDIKLGNLVIPKGTVLALLVVVMLHNKQQWGNDANDFNPERFSNSIATASTHPLAFIPFSIGPRNCIGQGFALMETKVVLCKLLQRFSFVPSTTYVHAPSQLGVLKPKHGMQIIVNPIDS